MVNTCQIYKFISYKKICKINDSQIYFESQMFKKMMKMYNQIKKIILLFDANTIYSSVHWNEI